MPMESTRSRGVEQRDSDEDEEAGSRTCPFCLPRFAKPRGVMAHLNLHRSTPHHRDALSSTFGHFGRVPSRAILLQPQGLQVFVLHYPIRRIFF
jgi:hypothetical protein